MNRTLRACALLFAFSACGRSPSGGSTGSNPSGNSASSTTAASSSGSTSASSSSTSASSTSSSSSGAGSTSTSSGSSSSSSGTSGSGSTSSGSTGASSSGSSSGSTGASAPSCSDLIQDGAETDVDCGGPDCMACADGHACAADSDCLSQLCRRAVCAQPSCTDFIQDGDETDIDCGGSCGPCSLGQGCTTDAECVSQSCVNGVCQNGCNGTTTVPFPTAGCVNITPSGSYDASSAAAPIAAAADQNLCSAWNSGGYAPAYWVVDFGAPRAMRGVTLIPDMSPAGFVEHLVQTSDDGVSYTTVLTIDQSMSALGTYSFDFGQDVTARYLRVYTTSSPSWVAWYEVSVFSCP